MDLRQMGEVFEKKFSQFSKADITKVAGTFHNWQQDIMINDKGLMVNEKAKAMVNDNGLMVNEKGDYNINNLPFTINNYNVPEYCYAVKLEEIAEKDFSLVPSKYIEFVNRDENIDFDEKMTSLKGEFAELLIAEEQSKKDLLEVFKTLGYGIE